MSMQAVPDLVHVAAIPWLSTKVYQSPTLLNAPLTGHPLYRGTCCAAMHIVRHIQITGQIYLYFPLSSNIVKAGGLGMNAISRKQQHCCGFYFRF